MIVVMIRNSQSVGCALLLEPKPTFTLWYSTRVPDESRVKFLYEFESDMSSVSQKSRSSSFFVYKEATDGESVF